MKRFRVIFICILVLGIFNGCSNPFSKFVKSRDKIESTERKITTNKNSQNDLSSAYVYGVSYVLSKDSNKNQYSIIAKDFAEKSLLITGNPPAKEAIDFRKIVDGLTSTNKVDNGLAIELLNKKDAQIVKLETKNRELEDKLDKQNQQFVQEAEKNAKDAQLMAFIRKWVRIVGFALLSIFGLRLACVFVPQLMPIGMLLDGFVGGLFKVANKALPKAAESAGFVAKESFELSEKTLSHVIEGIEELKRQYPETKDKLKPIMQDVTDKDTSRAKILDVKKDLGYI